MSKQPEIYAVGDKVAVYLDQYGKRSIFAIYVVQKITAKKAFIGKQYHEIPLEKKEFESKRDMGAGYTYKPCETSDIEAMQQAKARKAAREAISRLNLENLSTEQLGQIVTMLESFKPQESK